MKTNDAKIRVGDYELVHSGIVISIKDKPIIITLPDEIEGDFTFILNFISDNEIKQAITTYTTIDKFTLQVDLKNFDGFMGGGNTDLLTLGTLRNLPLFFNFRVFDLPDSSKTLIYNFYSAKEVKNGK